MADDRPVEDPNEQLGRLQRELDDLRSTLLARLTRRPTGDVEPTIRATPKANTLVLNGASVSRTTYAELWAWAQEAGVVVAGLFTTGDGSTTFGLPNFAGRVPVGVGTLGSDSYTLGALIGTSTKALSTANMPAHDHNVSGSTNSAGSHGGHFPGSRFDAASQANNLGLAAWNSGGASGGSHSHSVSITESSVGSGTPFDVRQPSIAINWLVWT